MKVIELIKKLPLFLNKELIISIASQVMLLGNSLLLPFFYDVNEIGNYGFWLAVITPLAGIINLKLDYQILKSKKILLEGIGLLACLLLCVSGISILIDIIFNGFIYSFISGTILMSILPIFYSILIIKNKRIYIYYNQLLIGVAFFIFIIIDKNLTHLGVHYNYIFSRYISLLIQLVVFYYLAKEIYDGTLDKIITRIYIEMRSKDAIFLVGLDLIVLTLQNAPMYLLKFFGLDSLLATYYYSFRLVKSPNMLFSSYVTNLVKSGNKNIISKLNIINVAFVFTGTIIFYVFYFIIETYTETEILLSYIIIIYTVLYVLLETNYEFKKYLYFVGNKIKLKLKEMGFAYIIMLILISAMHYLFGLYQDSFFWYLFLFLIPYLFASFKYKIN